MPWVISAGLYPDGLADDRILVPEDYVSTALRGRRMAEKAQDRAKHLPLWTMEKTGFA